MKENAPWGAAYSGESLQTCRGCQRGGLWHIPMQVRILPLAQPQHRDEWCQAQPWTSKPCVPGGARFLRQDRASLPTQTFQLAIPHYKQRGPGNGLSQPQQASAATVWVRRVSFEAPLTSPSGLLDPANSWSSLHTGSLPMTNLKQLTVHEWFRSCRAIIVLELACWFSFVVIVPLPTHTPTAGVKFRPVRRKLITEPACLLTRAVQGL